MFEVVFEASVEHELAALRPFDGRRILDVIERRLTSKPAVETRNQKMLRGIKPPFDALEPVWELRVGEYRVFYDVDEESRTVCIRAVRRKPPHKTTEEIL
jgi:mRNA-degrading endonuclease RelE of RelBE toxin-antitoxin system